MTNQAKSLTVVGVGEALLDCFPQGTYLGGAPVNLAVHAQQLLGPHGGRALVVSAVGQDEFGTHVRRELTAHGVSDEQLQESAEYPTGTVQVMIAPDGSPTFEIAADVAWDHIQLSAQATRVAAECGAICFGTLAQRGPKSRATIRRLVDAASQAWRVCDLNLRQQWWDAEVIASSFQLANVVKLSADELSIASETLGTGGMTPDERAARLLERFSLEVLALTRGKQGTVLYGKNQRVEGLTVSFPRESQADDVGAGDACCAAIVAGLLWEWELERIVNFANRVGAYVASQPGATPRLTEAILGLT